MAVKVLRPGIEAAIERDLDFLLWLAEWAERLRPALRRYRPVDTVRLLATTTRREMDLRLEAAAAAEFRQNCARGRGLQGAPVDWRRTAPAGGDLRAGRAACLPDERGAADRARPRSRRDPGPGGRGLLQSGVPRRLLPCRHASRQHADRRRRPRSSPSTSASWAGIDLATRRHLAEILVGFLSRDYRAGGGRVLPAGFVPADQDQAAFQQACRAIGEPILGLPLNEISIGRLLGQLLTVAEQFEMQQQPQLVLLQKTMAVSEGVGRALNPNVNIWQVAQPLVEGWIRPHLGPEAQARRVVADGVAMFRALPGLVTRLERLTADVDRPEHADRSERAGGRRGSGSDRRSRSWWGCCSAACCDRAQVFPRLSHGFAAGFDGCWSRSGRWGATCPSTGCREPKLLAEVRYRTECFGTHAEQACTRIGRDR